MIHAQLKIPSKTFLVGEYSALLGSPAIVINTKPYFEVTFNSTQNSEKNNQPYHPKSPAGKLFEKLNLNSASQFKNIDFNWLDPHSGKGGFGGSSAQFLSVYFLKSALEQNDLNFSQSEVFDLRDTLRELSVESADSVKPSGYDLVAQMTGGLSVIRGEERIAESLNWDFENKDFLIVRTGLKVNTHDHLAEFNALNFSDLAQISREVTTSLKNMDYAGLVGGVTEFQRELRRRNLSHQSAYDLLQKFLDLCDAGKCCGALGADSFLLFYSTDKSEAIRQRVGEINKAFGLNLLPVASSRDLAKSVIENVI